LIAFLPTIAVKTITMKEEQAKKIVQEKYAEIARNDKGASSCCGGDTRNKVYNIMMEKYDGLEGYVQEADLGLGCGLPTAFAQIQPGDTVIDLGSGAGNDCFVARYETGPTGKVIGIDFTPEMIVRARDNADRLRLNNVEFRQGDIENMPVGDNVADVIVSNCVLNLVPNKKNVITEIYRTLKPGGHFSISDIVLVGELPDALRKDAELYAGCVAGAIQKDEYLDLIRQQGFEDITIQKEKTIELPRELLSRYLSDQEIDQFLNGQIGIYSITVFAAKPGSKPAPKPLPVVTTKKCC
jgi:arsenite methyltransferase